MLWPYLKIWDLELVLGRAVKMISSPGVRSPCYDRSLIISSKPKYDRQFFVEIDMFCAKSEPEIILQLLQIKTESI